MAEPDEPKQPGEEPLPDDPKPAAAPRRSGWRRLGRVVLGVLIALVLVLVLGLVFIHTGPGRSAVQAFVEKTGGAAAGGELRFGSLDYRLWGGWLNAGRVHLTMEGTELDIGEAQVRWSPRGGVRLRIVRPNVVLRDSGKPKPVQHAVGIAARPWTALERVAQAELIDARIEMQDANGVAYLVLGDVDASLQERDGRRPIRLTVNDGVVGPPQRQLRPITGTGALTIEKGQLQFNAVHLDARGSTVDLEGSLDRLSPNEGALKLRADADGALAALVAPETEVKGRLRAQANLVAKDTMSGTLRLSSPDLAVQGIGPWDASLRGRFDSSHLVIEWGEALGYGGRFTVDGPVALADASKTDLNLRAENVDVAALGAAVAQTAVPIRSRMSASLRYTLSGWDVNQGRAEGEILLAPVPALPPRRRGGVPGVPVKGSSKVSVEGRRVRLSDLRVEAHNALVVGDVAVSPALDIQGRYRAELPLGSLGALFADMGMQPPASPLAGTLRAQGGARRQGQRPGRHAAAAGRGDQDRRGRAPGDGVARRQGALRARPAGDRAARRALLRRRAGHVQRQRARDREGRLVRPRRRRRVARPGADAGDRRHRRPRSFERPRARRGPPGSAQRARLSLGAARARGQPGADRALARGRGQRHADGARALRRGARGRPRARRLCLRLAHARARGQRDARGTAPRAAAAACRPRRRGSTACSPAASRSRGRARRRSASCAPRSTRRRCRARRSPACCSPAARTGSGSRSRAAP